MTLLKNQVVQAQCPNCQNSLRIPASWVGQMMRCKHCKQEFQAKAPKEKKPKQRKSILAKAFQIGRIKKKKKRKKDKSRHGIAISKPHAPPAAIPVGMPALPVAGMPAVPVGMPAVPGAKAPPAAIPVGKAMPAGIPVGMPPPPPSANPFANVNDGRSRRRGGGKQKLAFLFIFLLAIGGMGAAIYSVTQQKDDGSLASAVTGTDPFGKEKDKGSTVAKLNPPPITPKPVAPPTVGGKNTIPPIQFTKLEPKPKMQPPPISNPPVVIGETPGQMPPPQGTNPPPVRPPVGTNPPIRPPVQQPPINIPTTTAYDDMPRRMLAIVPANYYYANPVSTGNGNLAVANVLYQFADMIKVPPKNVVVVSDRPPGQFKAAPPIKPVIDLNLTNFVNSCRPYDRIVVFFMGHGVEIDGVPYLVPLEGEKDKTDDLIPLEWVYQKLAQCSARQKILILDVCRFDPTKGEERGKVDPMGLAFETVLQNPPPGVQVLTACAAGQHSFEIESNSQEFGSTTGGLMLSRLVEPEFRGRFARVTPKPEDAIPIDMMYSGLATRTKNFASFLKLGEQTPKLYGSEIAGNMGEVKPEPAPKVEVELAGIFKEGGVASTDTIRSLFSDIQGIPSVKRDSNEMSGQLDYSNLPPFAQKTIDPYVDDGKSTPFRELVREAVKMLKEDNVVLNLRFPAPQANQNAETQFKNNIENTQKQISLQQYKLSVILDELRMQSAERDKETKRWKANFEYVCARLEARIAYLHEYNGMLGNIRKDFPPRDPALHIGWQLASREKISDRDAAKNHKAALKHLEKLAADNGGTPWAMVAKREKVSSLGLDWVPLPR